MTLLANVYKHTKTNGEPRLPHSLNKAGDHHERHLFVTLQSLNVRYNGSIIDGFLSENHISQ